MRATCGGRRSFPFIVSNGPRLLQSANESIKRREFQPPVTGSKSWWSLEIRAVFIGVLASARLVDNLTLILLRQSVTIITQKSALLKGESQSFTSNMSKLSHYRQRWFQSLTIRCVRVSIACVVLPVSWKWGDAKIATFKPQPNCKLRLYV